MSCILKYFSFLCQLKGHDASNKSVTKDFDLKSGYKNGFLEDSEELCLCPCSFGFIFLNSKLSSKKIKELFINFHTFDFRPQYLPKYVDMGDFPPNDFFCNENLTLIFVSLILSLIFQSKVMAICLKFVRYFHNERTRRK